MPRGPPSADAGYAASEDASLYHEVYDETLHRLIALIQRSATRLQDSLLRLGLRYAHIQNLELHAQDVMRPHRTRPLELLYTCADEASRGTELSARKQSHSQRGGVPSAGR